MKFPLLPYLLLFVVALCHGQSPSYSGFGVDGELQAGVPASAPGDWFTHQDASGVLSLDSLNIFRDHIQNQRNLTFYSGMAIPDFSVVDNRIWYNALYGHDHLATDPDANPKSDDATRFAPWNFSENPENWRITSGYLARSVDLVDNFYHFRRDGLTQNDSLYLFGGLSTLQLRKGRFLDMEFYATDLKIEDDRFLNTGPHEGHTAWSFDATGKVAAIGDMDIGFAVENGSIIRTEIYIWVSRQVYESNTGFTYEAFKPSGSASDFGYARIATDPEMLLANNPGPTTAAPWGTFNRKLRPSQNYGSKMFFEFGLNLSLLGLDPAQYAEETDLCGLPWQKVLVKSRKSTDSGALLEDFSGPYPVFSTDVPIIPDGSILPVSSLNSCNSSGSLSLEAEHQDPELIYTWETMDPGHSFPGGSTQLSGKGLFSVEVDEPGTYRLSLRPDTYCATAGNPGSITLWAAPCVIDDDITVDFETSTIIEPWNNDIDLDQDIDPLSLSTTGLQPPAHGTITQAGTGEITYTPEDGYSGPDSFEYRICDAQGLCDTGFVQITVDPSGFLPPIDTDGDGVADSNDLDDDNDGIPDLEEQQQLHDLGQPDCSGEFPLDFSQPAILESGTDLQVGAVYRIAEVSPGIDALVSIADIHNATINAIDKNNEAAHAFRPSTSFEFSQDGEQAMVEYKIRFVTSGTYDPESLGELFMNFNDIDGTGAYGEQCWAYNPMSYIISNPTELTMDNEGQWLIATAGTTDYDQATNQNPQVNFGISFASRSEVTFRVGVIARNNGNMSTSRQHNIEFQCVTNYVSPIHYSLDSDFDGIVNHLDLDSDNDGIYDAVEAGHGQPVKAGIIAGSYGTNGLADILETTADNGVLNYSLLNTDGEGAWDFLDTDSDQDNCSDANEAYGNSEQDGGDNEYYGIGAPPATDTNGLVRSAPYNEPYDLDRNGIADHLESSENLILTHPEDQQGCPGEEVILFTETAEGAIVQWQENINGEWIDLQEDERTKHTQSSSLQILDLQLSDEGRIFRLSVQGAAYICQAFSDPASLRLEDIPNVQANASSTKILAGDWVTLTGSGATDYIWDGDVVDGEPIQLFGTKTFTVTGSNPNGCPNTDEITIDVEAAIDLSLQLQPSVSSPNTNEELDLMLTLSNDGPDKATGVQVAMIIPDGIEVISVGPGGVITGNLLLWDIATLDKEDVSLQLTALILRPELLVDEYMISAQVTQADQQDLDSTPANLSDEVAEDDEASLEFPTPTAELSISKTIDQEIVAVRDTVEFQVELNNDGPYTATGVQVEERLPSGYEFISSQAAPGTYDPGVGLWKIDSIPPGEQALLRLLARVNKTGEYLNTAAIINTLQWETDSLNNHDSAGVTKVHREANLSLSKSTDATAPEVGDIITFNLLISNAGPDHATDVRIEDRVPSGYTIISAGQGGKIENNMITWEIDELPPGEQELIYTLQINSPTGADGEYTNYAFIADSRQEDPNSTPGDTGGGGEDDEDSWELNLRPADLRVDKSISKEEASIGEVIEFQVTIENTERYAITNLLLEDRLPGGYSLLGHDVSHGAYNAGTGEWTIAALEANEMAALTMEVRVTETDDYINIASLTETDQQLSDQSITTASAGLTTIYEQADLSLLKSADNTNPEVGDIVTFTLLVSNAGPAHATQVKIEDRVPSGFTIISAGQEGRINGNLITWEIADLPPGEVELTYELEVNPPTGAEGEYENIAHITGSEQDDPDSDPNTDRNGEEDDEDSLQITPSPADIIVTKSVSREAASIGEIIEFQVTIENNAMYAITNLILVDRLPGGYSLLGHDVSHGAYNAGTGEWTIAALEANEMATLIMEVRVTEIDDYINIASLTETDQQLSDQAITTASAGLTTIYEEADLSLLKSADNSNPEVGDIVIFTLLVSNAGPAHATQVIIEDRVPSGFTIISAGQGGLINGSLITWEIAELPPGEVELTYELEVNPPTGAEGEYKNIALITHSDQDDPDSNPTEERNGEEDDEGSWNFTPPAGSLYIEKTVSQEEASIGEIIDFNVAVTNTGGSKLTNLVMEDRLPDGYKLLTFKVTHGYFDYNTNLWEIPLLEIGETAVMTMEVEVTDSDDYLNIVRVYDSDQWIPEDEPRQDEAGITVRGDCLEVYNEFSPNQDGVNEVLWVECIDQYPNNHLQVFDRWGNKVFEASGYNNTWRGNNYNPTYGKGDKELPVGTYYYILKLGVADLPDRTGWLYISR